MLLLKTVYQLLDLLVLSVKQGLSIPSYMICNMLTQISKKKKDKIKKARIWQPSTKGENNKLKPKDELQIGSLNQIQILQIGSTCKKRFKIKHRVFFSKQIHVQALNLLSQQFEEKTAWSFDPYALNVLDFWALLFSQEI